FRPVNAPLPVEVRESDQQRPWAVKHGGRWRRVLSIDDLHNVDEEWWRERPVRRMYYKVTLETVGSITVFRDLVDGRWYQQNV
ncbi:MAG TPA: DNA polymerase Y family protein, partial [Dehalococcoidia bacterium]|nr:DNA polymerase Y family protein [Dehalococcoidia bacterium]